MTFVLVVVFDALALEYDALVVIFGGLVVVFDVLALLYGLMFVLAVAFDALVQTRGSVDDSGTMCFHFE